MSGPSTQATIGLSERLARLAAGSAGSPPEALARAALVLAYSHGDGPAAVRFLKGLAHKSRPDLLGLVSDSSAMSRLSRQSRSAALASPSRGGAEDRRKLVVSLSRLVLTRLLDPVPAGSGVSDRALVERRRLFAVIGWDMIGQAAERGWNSLAINQRELAARMLSHQPNVARTLKDLAGLGWIRVHRQWRGSVQVYKLNRLSSKATGSQEVARAAFDLIGELADHALGVDRPIGSAAALIALADHPAWIADAGIGSRHWLFLLALAGDADPVALGLGARSVGSIRRELAAAGLEGAESWGLDRIAAALDAVAAGTDVADRLEATEAARMREAADRLAAVEEARAARPPRKAKPEKGSRTGSRTAAQAAPKPEPLPSVRYRIPEGMSDAQAERQAKGLEAKLAEERGGVWAGRVQDGYLVLDQTAQAVAAEPAAPAVLARATARIPEGLAEDRREAYARKAAAKMAADNGGVWTSREEGGVLILERTA
ncbi:hypothetical protein [Sinomonas sp. RB5]